MTFSKRLIWVSQKLSPKGRAWRMPEPREGTVIYGSTAGGYYFGSSSGGAYETYDSPYSAGGILYRLYRAISLSLTTMYNTAAQVSQAQLPDNPGFTIDDANDWYRRLGIYNSGFVSFVDMKAAIRQRMSFPTVPTNRQNYLFIQQQLRLAGFDVYVYENRFDNGSGGIETRTPATILGYYVGRAVLGSINYGQANYGATYALYGITLCVNYLEAERDADFAIGSNYRSTFFVAGATVSTIASVPEGRMIEFRQLLLKLKSQSLVAFLFVNYI